MPGTITTNSRCPIEAATFIDLLRWRALNQPDRLAYTHLLDGEKQEARSSYAELDRRARAIAAWLQDFRARENRVLLLYPPGLEYIAAFFGCLYAGAIAVPAYPPRLNRTLDRLQTIVTDAQARIALTTTSILSGLEPYLEEAQGLKGLHWLTTNNIVDELAGEWQPPDINGDTIAFLQYTSGSTSEPRGVMISHSNLLHNEAMIQQAFQQTEQSIIAGWLPLYHDMGLIGNVLQPLYLGAHCILMSPASFLQRPFRWLDMISRYSVTTSGAPNFAYDLCVRKISPEQREMLDLSSWGVAFNGSEPIQPETLDQFASAFEPCGFRREAFSPCYGLAEATLFVSGGLKDDTPILQRVELEGLRGNRVVINPEQDKDAHALIGCGHTWLDQKLVIVDPESMTINAPNTVGEIWVSGRSIARGYWNRPEETKQSFFAYLAETGEGPFLRTGDLGFMAGGELFVTGRLKDLIVIRGRNHYPQDIERTVEQSHSALRVGGGAAFSLNVDGEEKLVIVQEVKRHHKHLKSDEVIEAIRFAVVTEHGIQAYAVILIAPLSIPKTSSGKIQRRACRARLLDNSLVVIASSKFDESTNASSILIKGVAIREAPGAMMSEDERRLWLELYLLQIVGGALNVNPLLVNASQPLINQGIDSLTALELQNRIESDLGIAIPMDELLGRLSITGLVDQMINGVKSSAIAADSSDRTNRELELAPVSDRKELPLSFAQQRLWFLDQLTPCNAAYHIQVPLHIKGRLNIAAFEQSLDEIVRRHESLRTSFKSVKGRPFQVVSPSLAITTLTADLQRLSESERETEIKRLVMATGHKPFDLARAPLLRVMLLRLMEIELVVIFTFHHIISDGWSMSILTAELSALYESFTKGTASHLAELLIQYGDYACFQRRWLRGEVLNEQLNYWRNHLSGANLTLSLPADRARPAVATYRGATLTKVLSERLSQSARHLGQQEGVTLFMILLAVFKVLLQRYSGQDDVLVGTNIHNRTRREVAGLIGLFANTLVLRTDLSGDPTFRELLQRVRQSVLGAYAHQDMPYEKLVEDLQPVRDRSESPLFQAMFILQNTPEAVLRFSDLRLSLLQFDLGNSKFDLTMFVEDAKENLVVSLEYNSDLFEAATCQQMMEHFQLLLEDALRKPEKSLSYLSMDNTLQNNQLNHGFNSSLDVYYA
jgi:acyl-CoA synthetase (AMP-forming)/AMP-acid ligase II/acyl carrier protein